MEGSKDKDKEQKVETRGRKPIAKKGLFAKDLRLLMYGFGDVQNPSRDSVNVLEEMVIEYITDMCLKAAKVAERRGKVKVDDFKFVLRKDPKKLARVEELLFMSEDIERAKQAFDQEEIEKPGASNTIGSSGA
ncbi:uncharacterized protein VTP21DRAFT_5813 [Calcarisporiella thermophila]|uniref:uncharacterized protein n=1 Tax=Calcarisporiella thermophila TaxID=911321 RepID=UPI00374470DC